MSARLVKICLKALKGLIMFLFNLSKAPCPNSFSLILYHYIESSSKTVPSLLDGTIKLLSYLNMIWQLKCGSTLGGKKKKREGLKNSRIFCLALSPGQSCLS